MRERAGQDERFARQLRATLFLLAAECEPCLAQPLDEFAIALLLKEFMDAFGDARADFIHLHQFVDSSAHDRVPRTEVLREKLRSARTNKANAEAVHDALERQLHRRG